MTARELYNAALIEINKLEAPSLLLEDYNYLINKAVQQYTNKVYNRYEINQQATDDLRVLKATASLEVKKENGGLINPNELEEYYCELPTDYLHLLNCVVQYSKSSTDTDGKCLSKETGANLVYPARKLTADIYPSILINAYLKPDYKRPYYFITNVTEKVSSLSSEQEELLSLMASSDTSTVASSTKVKMQIRCGNNSKYTPTVAFIDYVKTPDKIELTQSDLDMATGVDNSQVLEFPDYVCYEIINEFTKLLLENSSDPRLQSNVPINQSIAVPGASS